MSDDPQQFCEPFAMIDFIGDDLDPEVIIQLFTISPVRPKKKGDRLGLSDSPSLPVAKTGYCGFSTSNCVSSCFMDDHVQYLLDEIEKNGGLLQSIVRSQDLSWFLTCFYDASQEGVSSELVSEQNMARANKYGIVITTALDGIVSMSGHRRTS